MARRHLHNRSATPLELPGTEWGGDPPLTGNERERERERERETERERERERERVELLAIAKKEKLKPNIHCGP